MAHRTPRHIETAAPKFENLEPRLLLSVAAEFDAETGTLTLTGDNGRNHIVVEPDGPGRLKVRATGLNDGQAQIFADVNALVINTGPGNDHILVKNGLRRADDATAPIDVTVTDLGGKNKITTGDGDDSITAGSGRDHIRTRAGDDTVLGGDGNDTIDGGAGDDSIDGGAGNDKIKGRNGDDTILGGDGDDKIHGGKGGNDIDGGDGDDKIHIIKDDEADVLRGGSGRDRIRGAGPDDETDEPDREVEPNQTHEQALANQLTLEEGDELEVEGAVSRSDSVDIFAVEITTPGTLRVLIDALSKADLHVEVMDSEGQRIGDIIHSGRGGSGEAELTIEEAGTYFVHVTLDSGRRSRYRLELGLESDGDGFL